MRVLPILYFNKDFSFTVKADQLTTIKSLDSFLKKDWNTNGKVQKNEFAFVHKNIMPKFYGFALIVFKGKVTGDNNLSALEIKARLTSSFIWFYFLPGIIIPIGYFLNFNGMYDLLHNIPIFNLILLILPVMIYLMSLFYYLMKINDVNNLLIRFKNELEK